MADKELSGLNEASAIAGGKLYIVDADGNSRWIGVADLKTFINTDPTIVPSSVPWRGARVRLTSNLTHNSSGNFLTASWASASVDTDDIWSAGAPTRLTVPAGVTKVRLSATIVFATNATGVRQISVNKNGDIPEGGLGLTTTASNIGQLLSATSSVMDVEAGDYFELRVYQNSGGSLNITNENRTWFQMEIVEAAG